MKEVYSLQFTEDHRTVLVKIKENERISKNESNTSELKSRMSNLNILGVRTRALICTNLTKE